MVGRPPPGPRPPDGDRRNSTRRELNRLAHRLLQINGEVSADEITASDDRRFSVGDRVTARRPNRDLHPAGAPRSYIRNGAAGTITATSHGAHREADTITVAFDDIGEIDVPRRFFDHHNQEGCREVGIDHAYALTSYAVQGSTHEVSTSRIDPSATRAETYVNITRGRLANRLYLTSGVDPLVEELPTNATATPVDGDVVDRLRRIDAELTAWELTTSGHSVACHADLAVDR